MGENYSIGWGGGASSTEVLAFAVFASREGVSASIRSSHCLTSPGPVHLVIQLTKPIDDHQESSPH